VLLGSVILVDILSMFLLSVSLSSAQGTLSAECLWAFAVIAVLFAVPWVIRRKGVRAHLTHWLTKHSHFETGVRATFALLFTLGSLSLFLGFHTILGAFVAGLIVRELTPQASHLGKKLEGMGYGFFVPLFFILVGAKVDLAPLLIDPSALGVVVVIIVAGMVTKLAGVSVATRTAGISSRESLALGCFHSARLSLIIAAAGICLDLSLIPMAIFSGMILLAVISSLMGPFLGKILLRRAPPPDQVTCLRNNLVAGAAGEMDSPESELAEGA
jgi:CPA2 family monovalent cation:H+ antiporter-2